MTASGTLAMRRGVAMSQHIPDRSGLRRRTDRFQSVVGWVLIAAALCTLAGAGVAAVSAYDGGLARIKHDAATRETVVAVLLDDATAVASGPTRPVRISYVDQAGRPQIGQVPIAGRLLAGTPVRVEVDGDGRVDVPPPTRGDAVLAAAAAAIGVSLLGGILLGLTWFGVRCAVTARNHAAWAREWRWVEPQWSGRGTAAP
jgi:hypothetical protein